MAAIYTCDTTIGYLHNSFSENTQEKSAAQNNLPRRVLLKIVS